jgi:lipoyl(octanoyl) transferase
MNYMSIIDNIEWRISEVPVDYLFAVQEMENRVAQINSGEALELIWLLEHPSIYTAGSSARYEDLLEPDRFPVHHTGRGGQFTYHGPGQRIVYVMLDLNRRGRDVRGFVLDLENWVIATLAQFNVKGERRADRIGIWVTEDAGVADTSPHEDKIAAIGIRIRRWITYHGLALNVEPNLGHFTGIIPCGIDRQRFGVTSLVNLGLPVSMTDVDVALMETFEAAFQQPKQNTA